MKKLFKFVFFFILSLPKTIYFNFATFPANIAYKLPVIIGYNVLISETHKDIVEIKANKIKTGMIRFGFGGPRGIISNKRGEVCLEKGKLIFLGTASFGEGCSVRINGNLEIGDHFSASKNSFISCSAQNSTIGKDVMLGWNCALRDSDGHTVYVNNCAKQSQKSFHIGNHVWICAEAHILKGVSIGSNSIVAYRSTVSKGYEEEGILIGGNPARLIQHGVNWGKYIEDEDLVK